MLSQSPTTTRDAGRRLRVTQVGQGVGGASATTGHGGAAVRSSVEPIEYETGQVQEVPSSNSAVPSGESFNLLHNINNRMDVISSELCELRQRQSEVSSAALVQGERSTSTTSEQSHPITRAHSTPVYGQDETTPQGDQSNVGQRQSGVSHSSSPSGSLMADRLPPGVIDQGRRVVDQVVNTGRLCGPRLLPVDRRTCPLHGRVVKMVV